RTLQRPELLQQIAEYNEADCKSTRGCRDWLLSLRPAEIDWFVANNSGDDDAETAEERRASEEATAALQRSLLGGARSDNDRIWRELLGNLLLFHKREAKHEWWEMFKRHGMTLEELLEDRASIADLRPDPDTPPVKVKRSVVHTFLFPDQDYRIRAGDMVLRAGLLDEGRIEVV